MSQSEPLRVGLCGIGLEAYWEQFEGLKPRLEGYLRHVAGRLRPLGVELVELGLIDTVPRGRTAGHACRRADIDLLLIDVTTYAVSSTVLPLVQRAGVPVILLNLQPAAALDYAAVNRLRDRTRMTGEWLAWCSACPMPEIANVLSRAGIPFHQVNGHLEDEQAWREIEGWIAAARVKAELASNRLGLMGHYFNGMYDVITDVTGIAIAFGSQIEILEVEELSALRESVPEEAVAQRVAEFHDRFDVQPDCSTRELERAARTSVALDEFVARHDLQSLAYYSMGSGNAANQDTMSSIILGTSLLTARHIPVAGEYEVKNAIAMKIMDSFGAGGSFTEFYAVDFAADLVLMGHDGPGHPAIAQGKSKVRPLQVYHGKVGEGLSVEMSVQYGPVTLLSVAEDKQTRFKLLVAEAECESGEILEIGNTNSRFRFPGGARDFVERWTAQAPSHHCAVGIGHLANRVVKLGALLGVNVCRL